MPRLANQLIGQNTFSFKVALLTLALLFAVGCGGDAKDKDGKDGANAGGDKPTLVFTAIPSKNEADLKKGFDLWAKHLSEKLGVKVEYKPVTDYKASVEMFKTGDVQLAWFGGFSGVQARAAVPGSQAIAMGAEDPNYVSYFIANKETGLTKSDDFPAKIADLKFTFGSPGSTSGRLMPTYFIQKESGKTLKEFFKTEPGYQQTGGHDATLDAVLAGSYDVGVLDHKVYKSRLVKDPAVAEKTPIIWITPGYTDYNFTAHPKLKEMYGDDFITKLQIVIVETKDKALLHAFPRSGMIEASNKDFDNIEKTAKALGLMR